MASYTIRIRSTFFWGGTYLFVTHSWRSATHMLVLGPIVLTRSKPYLLLGQKFTWQNGQSNGLQPQRQAERLPEVQRCSSCRSSCGRNHPFHRATFRCSQNQVRYLLNFCHLLLRTFSTCHKTFGIRYLTSIILILENKIQLFNWNICPKIKSFKLKKKTSFRSKYALLWFLNGMNLEDWSRNGLVISLGDWIDLEIVLGFNQIWIVF